MNDNAIKVNNPDIKKRHGFKQRRVKELVFYWTILALPLLQFVIMYVVVNINSFLLAFQNIGYDGETGAYAISWVGFKNFGTFINEIFHDSLMSGRFLNSLWVYLLTLFFGTAGSVVFSFYIYKKYRGSGFFRLILMLPSFLPAVVMVLIYSRIVDFVPIYFGGNGWLSGKPNQTFAVVLFYHFFVGYGSGVLMYSNAMSRIPDSLVESARLEGCGAVREFFKITLPLIYPTLETFLIIGLSNLFINQANLFEFFTSGAAPQIQTVGYYLFNQVFGRTTTMATYPYASAAGLVLTAVTIPIVMVARHFLDKLDKGVEF